MVKQSKYQSRWHRLTKAGDEDAVGSWVIRALEAEGSVVRVLGRPERDGTAGRGPRPVDWWVSVDGTETAIEVTTVDSREERWAFRLVGEAKQVVEAAIAGDPRSVLVPISYNVPALLQRRRVDRERDARMLATAVLTVLADPGAVHNRHLAPGDLPAWVRAVGVSASVNPPRPHVSVVPFNRERDVPARVDAFIRERIADKGDQHTGWGRGILAISHGQYESAGEVAAGFTRYGGPIPWWRVYWTDSEANAHLVADAPTT